jgi:hypothetical protein
MSTHEATVKPCEDCPGVNLANPHSVATIVYTGGPPQAIFALVERGIGPDNPTIITKWSRPTVHNNGTVEYKQDEAEPPEIEGYKRDASNPKLLRPVWPHCIWRCLRTWRGDAGDVKIIAICLTPFSGFKVHEILTVTHCTNCVQRTER